MKKDGIIMKIIPTPNKAELTGGSIDLGKIATVAVENGSDRRITKIAVPLKREKMCIRDRLYVEDAFEFVEYDGIMTPENVLTAEEITALDDYCYRCV